VLQAAQENPMLDSVRSRLTLWYSIVLGVVLISLAFLTYLIYQRNILQRTDTNLVEQADAFATTFASELPDYDSLDAVKNAARESMLEHRFRDTIFVVLDPLGGVALSSLDLPGGSPRRVQVSPDIYATAPFRELATNLSSGRHPIQIVPGGRDGFRGFARDLPVGRQSYRLAILQSLHPQHEMLEDIRNTFLVAIPIGILLASVGGYFLARKSLAPVAAMAAQAQTISASNLQNRLEVANERDELGQLAESFNQLLERLERSFERQQRFIADASHELRTPVAILRGEAEVTLARDDRTAGEYRESLCILRDESQRLARIVEDLFTLTRADAGEYRLTLREHYLDELVNDVLRRVRSLAIAKDITLASSLVAELPIRADEALLRRMFLNLIENAIKYTSAGGKLSVSCLRQNNEYVLSITDTGEGIPSELQQKIFERFFRVDKARSRGEGELGGAGLGLSIARWIAEAHNGRLELSRSDATGSTFTVILPSELDT
jgi:two-component system, OmpR family, sensor kinase